MHSPQNNPIHTLCYRSARLEPSNDALPSIASCKSGLYYFLHGIRLVSRYSLENLSALSHKDRICREKVDVMETCIYIHGLYDIMQSIDAKKEGGGRAGGTSTLFLSLFLSHRKNKSVNCPFHKQRRKAVRSLTRIIPSNLDLNHAIVSPFFTRC